MSECFVRSHADTMWCFLDPGGYLKCKYDPFEAPAVTKIRNYNYDPLHSGYRWVTANSGLVFSVSLFLSDSAGYAPETWPKGIQLHQPHIWNLTSRRRIINCIVWATSLAVFPLFLPDCNWKILNINTEISFHAAYANTLNESLTIWIYQLYLSFRFPENYLQFARMILRRLISKGSHWVKLGQK